MVSFIKRLKSFHTKNDNRKETMIMRKVRMSFCVLLIALTVFLVTGCTNRNNTGNGTAGGTTGGGTTTESTSGAGTNGAAAGESGGAGVNGGNGGTTGGAGTMNSGGTNGTGNGESGGVIDGIVNDVEKGVNDITGESTSAAADESR